MGFGIASPDEPVVVYRDASEEGWRTRSANKLKHLNKKYHIFQDVRKVVDLCAAPGCWSQVLVDYLQPWINPNVKIVAVDVKDMAPLRWVTCIKGDISEKSTANKIISALGGTKAELVVFDGAPCVTGLHDLDEALHSELFTSAMNIATFVLKEGGTFVAKIHEDDEDDISFLTAQIRVFFQEMVIDKPPGSRASSVGSYIVCKCFTPPGGYVPSMWNTLKCGGNYDFMGNTANAKYIPFVHSGDLTNFDEDPNNFVRSELMKMFKEAF